MDTNIERAKVEIPKRKPNHFFVFNNKQNKYDEIKYISQNNIFRGIIQPLFFSQFY